MRHKIKRHFTKWYVKRGYRFTCDRMGNASWFCPFWVSPLLIFFSPSIYIIEFIGFNMSEGFQQGLANEYRGWDYLLGGDFDGDELPKKGE